ncbi:MAG: hypothetical protein J5649_00975 [Lachnospiraceae bacterium]|nr:hypothetical protein [Lachnospiraceae bacterium]
MHFVTIIGIVAGAAVGLALALFFTVCIVKKSNDIGDSMGTLRDFHSNVNVFDSSNDVDKDRSSYINTNQVFREHLYEAIEEAQKREEKRKAVKQLRR